MIYNYKPKALSLQLCIPTMNHAKQNLFWKQLQANISRKLKFQLLKHVYSGLSLR